jgi:hypothetical protein
MNPEQNSSPAAEPQFDDCVKIICPGLEMIQFVGKRMTWGFAWSLLNYFVLKANPDCHDPKVEPVEELIFYFPAAKVTLLGWRLDLVLEHIASHSISRVWPSKKDLAEQNMEAVRISEIFVLPYDYDVLEEHTPADPPATSQQEQP